MTNSPISLSQVIDGIRNVPDHFRREFRVNRKRKRRFRSLFAYRQLPFSISQTFKTLLKMQRNGIVNL